MSTEILDEYLRLYSEYISLSVNLHNYNQSFLKHKGGPTSRTCRRTIKQMREILYHMDKLVYKVRREHLDNWKEEVASRKTVMPDGRIKRKRKTPNKRKSKNGYDNSTTKTTI